MAPPTSIAVSGRLITMPPAAASLVDQLDALLPQTQCRQCGYSGCRPYAEALARGEAGVDQCPPGGDVGAARLAGLLGVAAKPVNPAFGVTKPRVLALIDEAHCIGCTLCIQACPVDAIVGASKQMHTVLAAECTGCELCLPPCPVDCIVLQPVTPPPDEEALHQAAQLARRRHRFRLFRLEREQQDRAARFAKKLQAKQQEPDLDARKRATIQAAMDKARARLAQAAPRPPLEPNPERKP